MWGFLLQNNRMFCKVFGSGTWKLQVSHVAASSASENKTPKYLSPGELWTVKMFLNQVVGEEVPKSKKPKSILV